MRILAAIVLLVAGWSSSLAHGVKTKTIEIVHPWTLGTATAGGDIEVCAKIVNIGRAGDRLIGASTTLAAAVELIEPRAAGAVEPRSLKAIALPAGGTVELSRSGQRIALRGFVKALVAWDSFPLVLVFEKAGRIEVEVIVEER